MLAKSYLRTTYLNIKYIETYIVHYTHLSMWPSAVLLGDSQTQGGFQEGGWAQALAEAFVRRLDIVNRGFNGYNSRMLNAVLSDILVPGDWAKVKVCCIFLGSNDASLETNPEQAVPVEEFGDNLVKIISFLLNQGLKKESIIIISPPPVQPEVAFTWCPRKEGSGNLL